MIVCNITGSVTGVFENYYLKNMNTCTVEPQLSEPSGRHTIGSDKRRVCIG